MSHAAFKIGPFGEQLDYSRMSAFGAPFVDQPPLLPDSELNKQSKPYHRFGYGKFNSNKRSERIYGRTYGEIMEAAINRKAQILLKGDPVTEQDGSVSIYIEWAETLMLHESSSLPPREEPDNAVDTMTESVDERPDYIRVPNQIAR